MKIDHGSAENIQMISASSMSLLKMRANSGSPVIKNLKSIVGNVLKNGIKDSKSMIKILKNRKGFAFFIAPFCFVAATTLFAQDLSLEDRLELLKKTLLELDISATKCLEQLEDTSTKSETDCDDFLSSLDGQIMADYVAHCEVLKSWRDSFINDPSASDNDKETDLNLMTGVEYSCGDNFLKKRTNNVVAAFEWLAKNHNHQSGSSSLSLRFSESQFMRTQNQERKSLQDSLLQQNVRQRSEINQRRNQLEGELIRQQINSTPYPRN